MMRFGATTVISVPAAALPAALWPALISNVGGASPATLGSGNVKRATPVRGVTVSSASMPCSSSVTRYLPGDARSVVWRYDDDHDPQFVPGDFVTVPNVGSIPTSSQHPMPRPLKCVKLNASILVLAYR